MSHHDDSKDVPIPPPRLMMYAAGSAFLGAVIGAAMAIWLLDCCCDPQEQLKSGALDQTETILAQDTPLRFS